MGQAKKQRVCPAAGRTISAAECGEHRHGRYACPEACPFNPFAVGHYDALLELEGPLDRQTMEWRFAEDPASVQRFERGLQSKSGHAPHATAMRELFFTTRADGLTSVGRWAAAGFPGLRNDERTMMRGKQQVRVALLEVQCVHDDRRFDAVDLLDPARPVLRFVDKSMARRAGRFTNVVGWIYPLPHFWRIAGTAIFMPEFGRHGALKTVQECASHLGAPAEPEARRRWLAENFLRLDDALAATALARRQAMLEGMDAKWGLAVYDLLAPWSAVKAALLKVKTVEPDQVTEAKDVPDAHDALLVFEAPPPAVARSRGRDVLGRVIATTSTIRLEAMGAERLAKLRETVQVAAGERVRFSRERIDNVGGKLSAHEPAADPALVPPALLLEPERVDLMSSRVKGPPPGVSLEAYQAQLKLRQHREWFDQPLPVLGGATPRAAAGDPALRPQLVEIAKTKVRLLDRENLRTGRRDDLNDLLHELGLHEICFPPLPPGPPVVESGERLEPAFGDGDGDDVPWEDDDEDESGPEIEWPDTGPLPAAPLTWEESADRIGAVVLAFPDADDATDALDEATPETVDALDNAIGDGMGEDEFDLLLLVVAQIWFGLVPAGTAPAVRLDNLAARISRLNAQLGESSESVARGVRQMFQESRQPEFCTAMAATLISTIESMKAADRPDPAAVTGILLVVRVLVDEIDRALRE